MVCTRSAESRLKTANSMKVGQRAFPCPIDQRFLFWCVLDLLGYGRRSSLLLALQGLPQSDAKKEAAREAHTGLKHSLGKPYALFQNIRLTQRFEPIMGLLQGLLEPHPHTL